MHMHIHFVRYTHGGIKIILGNTNKIMTSETLTVIGCAMVCVEYIYFISGRKYCASVSAAILYI